MSTPTSHKDVKKSFEDLFKPRKESVEVEHDSFMLMAAFLSEIERVQEENQISRKDLADKIGTSASYLTQVFRSKKPLNFLTLAKIKRALALKFDVKAYSSARSLPVSYSVPQESLRDRNKSVSVDSGDKEWTGMYFIPGGQYYRANMSKEIPA
jgi:transcriptional regulator with XRE-family HTH domain